MGNPLTKSNEGFHPKGEGRIHRVTVDLFLKGNPGEINILAHAAVALDLLAARGSMPSWAESVTREVLDIDDTV